MVHGWTTWAALLIGRNPRINQWREMRHERGIKGGSRADEDFNVEDGLGSRFQRLRLPCAGFYANRSAGRGGEAVAEGGGRPEKTIGVLGAVTKKLH
jgi:hypothetical protein